jgi:hypothetical protein
MRARCGFIRAATVPDDSSPTETWPAMIAAATGHADRITGAHRTWLAPDGFGKAPVDPPRRAMGGLLGHAVRFGAADDVVAVGEGIETMLSLRCAPPAMPMAAALSANHPAALLLPPALRRLYIARDADAAGDAALVALTASHISYSLRHRPFQRTLGSQTISVHSHSSKFRFLNLICQKIGRLWIGDCPSAQLRIQRIY